jgi:capsular exopolysaccharide synthesis family protein
MADSGRLPALPPPVHSRSAQQVLAQPDYYAAAGYAQDIESGAPAVSLAHQIWILKRHRWKILSFILICLTATLIISKRLTPVFEATATVDVDRQVPAAIVGQESTVSGMNDSDQFLATQVKLIQSDSVLRPVAEQYRLRGAEDTSEAAAPENRALVLQGPVRLKQLAVSRPPNTYLLLISYRSSDPQMAADVSNAIAKSYLEHTYNIRIRASASLSSFMEKQLEELRAKMERSGTALAQFERELNVINPEEKTNIVSAQLLQLNTEYTNAQAERIKKSAAWNSMERGSFEAAQVSTQGETLRRLTERLDEAKQGFADIKVQFGARHPLYRKAAADVAELERQVELARANISQRVGVEFQQAVNREAMLKRAVAESKAEFDHLNARSFEYQQRKREAEADRKLYEELVRKIKEADINAGFQNNNIRIADVARTPLRPVSPNLPVNLLLALVFSSLVAVGVAVVSDRLDTTVRDAEQTSRYLGTEVIGLLPAVKNTTQLSPVSIENGPAVAIAKVERPSNGSGYQHNGAYPTISGFEEAIRTLRNTMLLADIESPLRSILLTSAGPGEGKTTTAIHLAIAHAGRGQRTLLVDGDLRRPTIHRRFGLTADVGLSSVLNGEVMWREGVRPLLGQPNLCVLPGGPISHRAADLVGPRLGELLDEFMKEFDLVVLDAPPLLGFAEPLQMATVVDGVLVISRAGETKRKAVSSVLAGLQRVRASVLGVVLNHVKPDSADGYSYYAYYDSNYGDRKD